ncbi:MAG: hypothetical protein NC201_03040 [Prevotella sp.]|nr:hypothetical protein [Bacteroides sp.]MCM1366202.1 hypothetical protein [Prevotella sp.]MCM1436954.1 hypothetical protein [Prevotella sp.]
MKHLKLIFKYYSLLLLSAALLCGGMSGSLMAQKVNTRPSKANPAKTNSGKTNSGKRENRMVKPSNNLGNKAERNTLKQSNSSTSQVISNGLSKVVLYTFSPGETLVLGEYTSMHSSNNSHFAIMTQTQQDMSLIIDGVKKEKGRYIEVYSLDLSGTPTYTARIYDGTNSYLVSPSKREGPYESTSYIILHPEDPSKVLHTYQRMGMKFLHNYDGTVKQIDSDKNEFNCNVPIKSPNGSYSAMPFDNQTAIRFSDGTTARLFPSGSSCNIYDMIVYNNGAVWVYGYGNNAYFKKAFKAGSHNVVDLGDNDRFDWKNGRAFTGASMSKVKSPYDDAAQKYGYEWTGSENRLGTQFYFQTPDSQHEFVGNWKYDYVLIDGKQYGQSYPYDAWYDRSRNAFVWVGLEGNKLIQYVYRV